jgi:hypothetical protein
MSNAAPIDLSRLWEEHTSHEFATRDTEATLATMVPHIRFRNRPRNMWTEGSATDKNPARPETSFRSGA